MSSVTVTTAGLVSVVSIMMTDTRGSAPSAYDYVTIGDHAWLADPSGATTTMGNELQRTAGTGTKQTRWLANDTCQWTNTFSFAASYNIREAAIFNYAAAGNMLSIATFTAIPVTTADTLAVTYQVSLTNV